MRPILALIFVTVLAPCWTLDTTTDDFNNNYNNIESTPPARLDPYIRKALLRALSELEESGDVTTGFESTDGTTGVAAELLRNDDYNESQTEKSGIQIHSFVVNGQAAFANSTSTPTALDKNIAILSTTAGNVENQASISRPTLSPFTDIYQSKATSVNLQQVRSIPSSTLLNLGSNEQPSFKPTLSTTTTSTTTTTTTTTTPKPTHNEDGANIEEVDKKDVQVYQAPLVAAFTVHQDANGLPKKVVPIYQQTKAQHVLKQSPTNSVPTNVFTPQPLRQSIPIPTVQPSVNPILETDFFNQQLALQRALEQKQRILEGQLRLLQLQQSQQEDLLRKQQFYFQNKHLQGLQNNAFEQVKSQSYLINNAVNNFPVTKTIQQNQVVSQSVARPLSPLVSIQHSVPIEHTTVVSNQQQLPSREAVDFLLNLRNQQPSQFPLQENHLPQGIGSFLQPTQAASFHQGVNLNQISSNQINGKHNTRVFRQEAGVGNFGINHHYNRFNTYNPVVSNRYFPQQVRPNPYSSDFELKQLLLNSGLQGRQTEDLNIVSKVLSLNHGIPLDTISNRLPFDSRRQVNRFI